MSIFIGEQKYNILDLGFDKSLTKALLSLQGDITPELANVFTQGTAPKTLIAGELISVLEQQAGAVFSGKTTFNNTESGYRLGIDTSDGLVKFYIGDSSNYLNWTGSALNISGALSVDSIDIGGADVTSMHVDVDGNMWLGGATFAVAPFSVSNAGVLTSANTSAVITGAIIQTATSGSRVKLSSTGIQVYDSDQANEIGLIQSTESGVLFSSTSPNVAGRMFQHISFLQEGSNTNAMAYFQANDVSTGTKILDLRQQGDSDAFVITNTSSSGGRAINIAYSGNATEVVKILNDTASVIGLYVSNTFVSSNAYAAEFRSSGAGAAAGAVYIEGGVGSISPLQVKQTNVTSTNFWKIMAFNGGGTTRSIWISDGTTPNGNLSGTVGDICLYGPSGQPFYCTGTTNWTAM